MKEKIKLNYINDVLQIGLVDIKTAYLLKPSPTALNLEVYRGKLVYRAKGSSKRTSYDALKKGLKKTSKVIKIDVPDWPV